MFKWLRGPQPPVNVSSRTLPRITQIKPSITPILCHRISNRKNKAKLFNHAVQHREFNQRSRIVCAGFIKQFFSSRFNGSYTGKKLVRHLGVG